MAATQPGTAQKSDVIGNQIGLITIAAHRLEASKHSFRHLSIFSRFDAAT
jgi:hypothetical protein